MIRCHANLNHHCLSAYRDGATKVEHLRNTLLHIEAPRFVVQPGGHDRIQAQGRREVVAYIKGEAYTLTAIEHDPFADDPRYTEVSYNPIHHPNRSYFYLPDGTPILSTSEAFVLTTESLPNRAKVKAYVHTPKEA